MKSGPAMFPVTPICMLAQKSHSANLFLHSRPKPSAFMMASRSRSSSLALPTYAGSSSVLKQVWLVGSLAESPPSPCSVEQKPEIMSDSDVHDGAGRSRFVEVAVAQQRLSGIAAVALHSRQHVGHSHCFRSRRTPPAFVSAAAASLLIAYIWLEDALQQHSEAMPAHEACARYGLPMRVQCGLHPAAVHCQAFCIEKGCFVQYAGQRSTGGQLSEDDLASLLAAGADCTSNATARRHESCRASGIVIQAYTPLPTSSFTVVRGGGKGSTDEEVFDEW